MKRYGWPSGAESSTIFSDGIRTHSSFSQANQRSSIASLNLEPGLYSIGNPATKERFGVRLAVGVLIVVRALEILKPGLVRAIRPLSTGEKF
jgi:hypothetical protein